MMIIPFDPSGFLAVVAVGRRSFFWGISEGWGGRSRGVAGAGPGVSEIRLVERKKYLLLPPRFAFWKKMIMDFLSKGWRDAVAGQGDADFFAWTYASFDRLEEILRPGYFNGAHRLAPGDLVYVGTRPRPATSPWSKGQASTEIHRVHFHGAYRPVGLHEACHGQRTRRGRAWRWARTAREGKRMTPIRFRPSGFCGPRSTQAP